MTWWWVFWFVGALGISAAVLFIGLLLSSKKAKDPYQGAFEHLIAYSKELSEYDQMRRDALAYVEQLYQNK